MHNLLNPFRITAHEDVDLDANVILRYQYLTQNPLSFWPITECRKIRMKKGERRTDLDNITTVADPQEDLVVKVKMPDKADEPFEIKGLLLIERRF